MKCMHYVDGYVGEWKKGICQQIHFYFIYGYGWMEEGGMSAVYLCIVSMGIWVNDGVCAALWL
jgi:hypothetical protein